MSTIVVNVWYVPSVLNVTFYIKRYFAAITKSGKYNRPSKQNKLKFTHKNNNSLTCITYADKAPRTNSIRLEYTNDESSQSGKDINDLHVSYLPTAGILKDSNTQIDVDNSIMQHEFVYETRAEDSTGDQKDENHLLDQLIYKWCIRYISKSMSPPLLFQDVCVIADKLRQQLNLHSYRFNEKIWDRVCNFKNEEKGRKVKKNLYLSLEFVKILKEDTFDTSHKTMRHFLKKLEKEKPMTCTSTWSRTKNDKSEILCKEHLLLITSDEETEFVNTDTKSSSCVFTTTRYSEQKSFRKIIGPKSQEIVGHTSTGSDSAVIQSLSPGKLSIFIFVIS